MSKRYEYDLTVYFQNSYICTEWKSTKYGLRDQVHGPGPSNISKTATSARKGKVQNMDSRSMDPLHGPGPSKYGLGSWPPFMDQVHGPHIFTSSKTSMPVTELK